MDFNHNYFELFGLAPHYFLDLADLSHRYRELQRVYHPDRFAGKPSREVRMAVQYASRVNQAFETLKTPVSRAWYLLELRGVTPGGETSVTRDSGFLMEQMELREALQAVPEAGDPFAALEALERQARDRFAALENTFDGCFAAADFGGATAAATKMQFLARFLADIEACEEALDQ